MSRKKRHLPGFDSFISRYCDARMLDFEEFANGMRRITDGGFVIFDCWPTGTYNIIKTDYRSMVPHLQMTDRAGERSKLSERSMRVFMDKLFFPESWRKA